MLIEMEYSQALDGNPWRHLQRGQRAGATDDRPDGIPSLDPEGAIVCSVGEPVGFRIPGGPI